MASMPAEEKQELKAEFDAAMPSAETIESLSPGDREQVQERVMEVAAKMPDTMMEEPMPAGLAGSGGSRDAGCDARRDGCCDRDAGSDRRP